MVDIILDSSVLIGISQFSMKQKNRPRHTEKPIFDIRELMSNGEINVIVPQTVYKEIKRGKNHDNGLTQKFVNTFCEVIIPSEYEKDKALCLTDAYGNVEIGDKPAIEEAEDNLQRNYRDAKIIAEARDKKKKILAKMNLKESDLVPQYQCKNCNDTGVNNGYVCSCYKRRRK